MIRFWRKKRDKLLKLQGYTVNYGKPSELNINAMGIPPSVGGRRPVA